MFFHINVNLKETNTIQHSMPSIVEIDMTSSGSDYERHLTIPLTTIGKTKKEIFEKRKKCD